MRNLLLIQIFKVDYRGILFDFSMKVFFKVFVVLLNRKNQEIDGKGMKEVIYIFFFKKQSFVRNFLEFLNI